MYNKYKDLQRQESSTVVLPEGAKKPNALWKFANFSGHYLSNVFLCTSKYLYNRTVQSKSNRVRRCSHYNHAAAGKLHRAMIITVDDQGGGNLTRSVGKTISTAAAS